MEGGDSPANFIEAIGVELFDGFAQGKDLNLETRYVISTNVAINAEKLRDERSVPGMKRSTA